MLRVQIRVAAKIESDTVCRCDFGWFSKEVVRCGQQQLIDRQHCRFLPPSNQLAEPFQYLIPAGKLDSGDVVYKPVLVPGCNELFDGGCALQPRRYGLSLRILALITPPHNVGIAERLTVDRI